MAWTTPPTFTDGNVLTGAQLNIFRDNFLETAPAKATAAGQFFVATGANAIAARLLSSNTVSTSQSSGSTSYTDLATVGPQIASLTTGTRALAFFAAHMTNTVAGSSCYASPAVSGASTVAATDDVAVRYQAYGNNARGRHSGVTLLTGLTAGSNTFTLKYRVDGNSGTWLERELIILPF